MPIKASELKGNNRCYFRRSRDIHTESSKNMVFDRVVFEKNVIKNWFYSKSLRGEDGKIKFMISLIKSGVTKEDSPDKDLYTAVSSILRTCGVNTHEPFDERKALLYIKLSSRQRFVKKLIREAFEQLPFETPETAFLQAEKESKRILRYLTWETRTPVIPESEVIKLSGLLEVVVKPDLLFINEKDGSAEAVKICCRKPDVTATGKKKDRSVKNSLELYALWRYALETTGMDRENVSASYYFLGTKRDKKKELAESFFVGDGKDDNIVTLFEGLVKKESLDAHFEPQVEEFIMGEKCSGETCEKCDFNNLCNFNNAPLKSETPKSKKSVRDISLSRAQEDAVYFRNGIVRVNAGAGAGKTLVVALRTAFMLDEGINPEEMLLITFTEAGANEMKERIQMYDEDLGTDTDMSRLACKTFNAFGNDIIKSEYKRLGFDREPRLIDNIERKEIIANLLSTTTISGLDYSNFSMNLPYVKGALATCEAAFDIIKKERLSSYSEKELKRLMLRDGYGSSINNGLAYQELLDLYAVYDEQLRERALLEFADQERLLFDLLDIDPYYFDSLGYKHITIDEYQNTSENQMELVKKLVNTRNFESLMVVGDDSQSIYSFRGACSENIINFFDILGMDGEDIYITENYRSDPEILDFANKLNAKNLKRVDKDLLPTRTPNGKKPVVKGFHSVKDEYAYIAEVIKEKQEEGIALDDIAVLAATRSELLKISSVLTENGIETILQAPQPMMENSRVLGLIALAHAFRDENATEDILTFVNCLENGEILNRKDEDIPAAIEDGKKRIHDIKNAFGPAKTEAFKDLADEIAGDDELALNLSERLLRFKTVDEKIDYLEIFEKFGGEALKREGKYSGVVLSTAHSSKGLEWPVIINSITKYDRNEHYGELDEKRRLMFVSVTRARDELYVTGQIKTSGNKETGYSYNRLLQEAAEITGTKLDKIDTKGIIKDKLDKEEAKKRLSSKKEAKKTKLTA